MTDEIKDSSTNNDSQALLNQVILDYLREQKRKRRWRWFFRAFIIFIIGFSVLKLQVDYDKQPTPSSKPHAGLIDLSGVIFSGSEGGADNFIKAIAKAYENPNMKALIIRINSNGGSPVQAEYMFNILHEYREKYPDIKTYAVCVDACLSAAYYVAAGADEIYASPVSLVGSIGVVYNGFGFVDTMEKLGVTRRLQTAGIHKGFLDPFSPENNNDEQRLQTMLDLIHQQFIKRVKEGRGARLHISDETFTGLFWTGQQALGMGLIDGFASAGQLVRDKLKMEEVVDYTYQPGFFERFSKGLGEAAVKQLPIALGLTEGIRA